MYSHKKNKSYLISLCSESNPNAYTIKKYDIKRQRWRNLEILDEEMNYIYFISVDNVNEILYLLQQNIDSFSYLKIYDLRANEWTWNTKFESPGALDESLSIESVKIDYFKSIYFLQEPANDFEETLNNTMFRVNIDNKQQQVIVTEDGDVEFAIESIEDDKLIDTIYSPKAKRMYIFKLSQSSNRRSPNVYLMVTYVNDRDVEAELCLEEIWLKTMAFSGKEWKFYRWIQCVLVKDCNLCDSYIFSWFGIFD